MRETVTLCKYLTNQCNLELVAQFDLFPLRLRCLLKSLLGSLPVDDLPELLEVLCLVGAMSDVPRVLPHVDTDEWDVRQEWVLVLCSDNVKGLCVWVVTQPSPSRALNGSSLSGHLLLEVLKRSVLLGDERLQLSIWKLASAFFCWSQVEPPEGVVDVAWQSNKELKELFVGQRFECTYFLSGTT